MSALAASLLEKIKTRRARTGVVGLGYVGLPLAVELGKAGFHASGIDLDARKIQAIQEGRSMPLPQLERKVLPFMGGADYLGPELNGGVYRFKFIQDGKVIWVDVDARSGRILRRSRPR